MAKVLEPDEVYLQVHGLAVRPERLNEHVTRAIDQMRRTFYGESSTELTDGELQVLAAGGFDLTPALAHDPAADAIATFAALLATSLNTPQAAERLGVKATRARQMLTEHSLYGIRIDGRWHIPQFQFGPQGLVPHIGKVIASLDPALHPVAVWRWFTLPDPDLATSEVEALSPLDWLRGGGPVEPVTAIARHV